MIKVLSIERFKSVRRLQINCRRINLFIGEPNTGKSNILEALGFLGWCAAIQQPLSSFVRLKGTGEMFYDNLIADEAIRLEIQGDQAVTVLTSFDGTKDRFDVKTSTEGQAAVVLDHNGNRKGGNGLKDLAFIKFYRYQELDKFDASSPGVLIPPHGANLFSCVYASKELRERVVDLFRPYGLALVMKPQDKMFEVQKNADGVVTAFRYGTTSDTLLRVVFYLAAMNSNKNATLVFEEPEAHAFPYFTKQMGEEIAFDSDNQYFIATHNPYLLTAIVEKAKKEDVSVFVTSFKDYETHVRPLTDSELSELLSGDPFFMSQRFVEESGE
jgi:hypothetical protein